MFGQKKKTLAELQAAKDKNNELFFDLIAKSHEAERLKRDLEELKEDIQKKDKSINKLRYELKKLSKARYQFSVELDRMERFYINLYNPNTNKTSTCPAEIIVISAFLCRYDDTTMELIKQDVSYYYLDRIYWVRGGKSTFEDSLPQLKFGEQTTVTCDKGRAYVVTLTDDKVKYTQKEIDTLTIKEQNFKKIHDQVIKDIETLISEQEQSFPYFSNLLSDYRDYLNKRYSKEILLKSDNIKLSELRKELKQTKKKYLELKYQMEFYESKLPELKNFRKDLKKKK